jgi:capsular polysaccharide biosynthesis protein
MKKRINISISEKSHERATEIAKRIGSSFSGIVEALIDNHLPKIERDYELITGKNKD